VNVHPAKIEVRFRHPQFVHDFTRDSIRQALSRARPIPSFAGVAPSAPSNGEQGTAAATIAAAAGANQSSTGLPRAVIPPMGGSPMSGSPASGAMMNAASGARTEIAGDFELTVAPLQPEAQRFRFESGIGMVSDEPFSGSVGNFSEAEPLASAGSLTELKPLGQVNSSFIVAVNSEGLWIIDQHVAHERVLFEQHLRARREGQLTGQRMLVPMMVELSPRQIVIFERIAEELTANGFRSGANGAAQRGDPRGAGGNRHLGRRAAADGNPRRHRARERGDFDGLAAGENRGVDFLPCCDQGEHAARPEKNGVAPRGARENGSGR